MDYSRKNLEKLADESHFLKDNLEKVLRLSDLLDNIFSSSVGKNLVLKGGTAINLAYFKLPRLSVDIDLDYTQLPRAQMIEDRKQIKSEIYGIINSEGYTIGEKTKEYFALESFALNFKNNGGNQDNIKIEINYMNRAHLFETQQVRIKNNLFEGKVDIKTVDKYELFGSKIAAMLSRAKPRDLYDINSLMDSNLEIDMDILRKSAIFYSVLGDITEFNTNTFNIVKEIKGKEVLRTLQPLIPKIDKFDYIKAIERTSDFFEKLFVMNNKEMQFVDEFIEGNYLPGLLFPDKVNPDIFIHPMAQWKILNIKKRKDLIEEDDIEL